MTSDSPTGFRIVTALWGDWFVNAFLNHALPTLLAPKNIPALSRGRNGTYTIVTHEKDAERIRAHPIVAYLTRFIALDLIVWPEETFRGNPHEAHKNAWDIGIKKATEAGEWLAFAAADVCWSDGSLAAMARAFDAGKTSVFVFHHRVVDETFAPLMSGFQEQGTPAIVISSRTMAELAVEHLSPLSCSYFRDSEHVPGHTELLYFPVPGEGAILRSIVTHVWACNPSRAPLGSNLTPVNLDSESLAHVEFITDSDDFINVSLTPFGHQMNWYYERMSVDAIIEGLLGHKFFSSVVNHLWRVPFRLHYRDMTPSLWQRALHWSDIHMLRVYLTTRTVRLIDAARCNGRQRAAELGAASLHLGLLRHLGRLNARVRRAKSEMGLSPQSRRRTPSYRTNGLTVLLPPDEAIDRAGWLGLFAPGREQDLCDKVLEHVLVGRLSADGAGSLSTLSGRELSVANDADGYRINNVRVIGRITEGDFTSQLIEKDGNPISGVEVYKISDILQ